MKDVIDTVIHAALLDKINRIDGDHSYRMKLSLYGGNMKNGHLKEEGEALQDTIETQVLSALKEAGLTKVAGYYREYIQRLADG